MPTNPTTRRIARIFGILFVAFLPLQFVRPSLPNTPATAELQAPDEVKQILKNSCYNCHSNETKLWWFDQLVPAYWLVAKDVKTARQRLNFSEIGKLPPAQQQAVLFESVSQIELGAMPTAPYRRLHPDSVVTAEQLSTLKKYLAAASAAAPTASQSISGDEQYAKWIPSGTAPANPAPAPNGIAFPPDYKTWRVISSTDRFDNHTMRQILGNAIAVQAIAENRINPWPDGASFAKIAWFEQPDADGRVKTGAFFQVEFMFRDSKKYAATKGWGWARWRGADLKPYGKDANFTAECVGCHAPLETTNYVFTQPLRGQK